MSEMVETKEKGEGDFDPSPRSEWSLISQGAEARVWKLNISTNTRADNSESLAVCKERFSKAYRHPDLDSRLTKSRCRSEAKILEKCAKKTKIRVPKVIRISPPSLYLEYLVGPSVKSYLREEQMAEKETSTSQGCKSIQKGRISEKDLASRMGELVGRLHNVGIVHGDLTTSNMMIVEESSSENGTTAIDLALIDFGLSKSTASSEEQAVDLYVLERALLSTHPDLSENFFDLVLEKYKSTTEVQTDDSSDDYANGSKDKKKRKNHNQTALQRLEQVRMRGRKRECFG
mmetsp:Transcript_5303/g.12611  ORF Transcript_5303/g.12611 Transcript_5303/m.12611 type:complete len:289 (-) Transcript_5303:4356-5222(-)